MRRAIDRRLSSGSSKEILEEPMESPARPGEMEEEDKVFVALGKEVKEGKQTLLWALQNTSKEKKIIIVHIHSPPQKIPIMGAWFPANQLRDDQVAAFRRSEREITKQKLDEYINMCSQVKVKRAETLVMEAEDVGKGLVYLIALHGITKLVMGASADRNYNRRMNAPTSKVSLTVQQQADPSCKVWFVCKGHLICTRDAGLDRPTTSRSPSTNSSSPSSQPEQRKSRSIATGNSLSFLASPAREAVTARSKSVNSFVQDVLTLAPLSISEELIIKSSALSVPRSIIDSWDVIPGDSQNSSHSVIEEANGNTSLVPSLQKNENEEGSSNLSSMEDEYRSSPQNLEDVGVENDIYDKLQNALIEAESAKHEAYEECRRRQKAEKDLYEATRKVRNAENLYANEAKERKNIQERLEREKMEMEAIRKEREHMILVELQKANELKQALELQIADSERTMKDITGKLSEAHYVLNTIRREQEVLRRQRDDSVKENDKLRLQKNEGSTSPASTSSAAEAGFVEFSYSELQKATEDFSESLKVGRGGYGSVYKGFLRHNTVAIKLLNPDGLQGIQEFHQEMNVLSKVRHPNLVNLIGVCPEKYALVYEFLPSGSLEDRLGRKDDTPALTWQARTRIAVEICSALVFLHSSNPHCIVHGDLKPGNILLDATLTSKLGDFGICRLLVQSTTTTIYHCTFQPKGTFAYMDPELLTSGEITARSDVYSFGVILLRLLTGKQPFGISKVVQEALEHGSLYKIIDPSAGEWPYAQAEQLAALGVRCAEVDRRNRPDARDVLKVLEPLARGASFAAGHLWSSFKFPAEEGGRITPSYFICPIRREVMRDPYIAADGFTYEGEAIKEWVERGHDTSPMTNLKLPHLELIPNQALRAAMQGCTTHLEFI